MPTNQPPIQDIETLKKRHRELDRQKTTAEANCGHAEDALQKLKDEAMEKYGTSDLNELKEKLEKMKLENDRKRADYQKHLDAIEEKLQTIEKQYEAKDSTPSA